MTNAEPRTLAEACDLVQNAELNITADGTFGEFGGAVLPPPLAMADALLVAGLVLVLGDPDLRTSQRRVTPLVQGTVVA